MPKKQPVKKPTGKTTRLIQIAVICVGLVAVVFGVRTVWNRMLPPLPPSLTAAQGQAIVEALAKKGYSPPALLKLDEDRLLTANLTLDDPKSPAYLKGFATEGLMTIRDALQPHSPAKRYLVNIKGASPDPDMMIQWGHATFVEGDSVHWEPGK
jgi:hypothetical protein